MFRPYLQIKFLQLNLSLMQSPELQVNMFGKHFDKVRFILEVTTPTTSDWQSELKAPISHSRRPIGIWNCFVLFFRCNDKFG
jgi:hypothetical protein